MGGRFSGIGSRLRLEGDFEKMVGRGGLAIDRHTSSGQLGDRDLEILGDAHEVTRSAWGDPGVVAPSGPSPAL